MCTIDIITSANGEGPVSPSVRLRLFVCMFVRLSAANDSVSKFLGKG